MNSSVVVSRLPGRLRLRHGDFRQVRTNRAVCEELAGWDGVISAEGNPATGGVLVLYDVARLRPEAMEARLADRFDAPAVAEEASPTDTDEPAGGERTGLDLWQMNRVAKIGMLGSLAGTLLALSVGKKMHAAFGVLHLAFLLVHLANHRKRLMQ